MIFPDNDWRVRQLEQLLDGLRRDVREHIAARDTAVSQLDAVTTDRDRLAVEVADVKRQRDEAFEVLDMTARPVYDLVAEMNRLRSRLDERDRQIAAADRQLDQEMQKNRSLREIGERLRSDLETTRQELRTYKARIVDAERRVIEMAIGLEPESPILRDRSARSRAIEAAQQAEEAVEAAQYKDAAGWSQVAQAWAAVAMIPEKRSND
jgi:chromosome segregation ATPase